VGRRLSSSRKKLATQNVVRTIGPRPHFVAFARAVLLCGADITLVWRPLIIGFSGVDVQC
jgi:hypothetical protein